jgi:hypothetical protein
MPTSDVYTYIYVHDIIVHTEYSTVLTIHYPAQYSKLLYVSSVYKYVCEKVAKAPGNLISRIVDKRKNVDHKVVVADQHFVQKLQNWDLGLQKKLQLQSCGCR